ncbi:endo-alpha-N-acetylgalactosaminidase family protein [Streptomyces sp. HNM0574]|uniref:endo-alpha-N-acetylgalactosaminidase family protein n=1 Tax=Streptomyces sp. HNM0574 TaxID=2714954 RepID=UPI00146C9E53|nr:endo-alpha-N-acetylgalactosaminidase family protein [Streptomyces sp. HNM0574]NLU67556.1 hypothetical protein [Streptomyces sp. HNM0574]
MTEQPRRTAPEAEPEPAHTDPARRSVVAAGAIAGAGAALGLGGTARAAVPHPSGETVLRSGELDVHVDTRFPRVIRYVHRATGARLHGQQRPVTTLLVDGETRTPHVTSEVTGPDRIAYTLTLGPETGTGTGTEIGAEIRVEGDTVRWRLTRVDDHAGAPRVGTLRIPGLAFLAVRDDQPGAELHAARVEIDKNGSGDTVVRPADAPPTEPRGCAYAVVATRELAAALDTNTSWDKPTQDNGATWENGRLWHRTTREDGHVTTAVACGEWTHRADTAAEDDTEPLPYVTVVVTRDRNGDGTVDWQDAAIALRGILTPPPGGDEQHLRVVPHIPFNFASQATNPFLATLDEIKRISLATAGLRQYTLLKGYQSEGHDSAHPDYAGNHNRRAGGLADLNTLLRAGKRWNTDFAVHVNATESYPVAHAFSETLVDVTDEQWDWLDQSYRIDQRRDLVSGDIVRRFRDLRAETDEALDTLYLDVFRESGWTSDRLQRELRAQGWRLTTEWGHGLERSAIWSHWATETDYGADDSRGVNSRLIRFLHHHHKDVFADKWPTLLGIPRMGNYEGWTGKTDWAAFYELIWRHSLPAKYLQAHPIRTWTAHEITFFGETATAVTDTGGTRRITTDGRLVYQAGAYLLPWEPRRARDPDRLYHYNPEGGRTSWRLPAGWADATTLTRHRLTGTGPADPTTLRVTDGRVTLDAAPGTPYVLHRAPRPAPAPDWGEGTPLADPGFHSGTLDAWQVEGPSDAVAVTDDERGVPELVVTGAAAVTVSQRLSRLRPGTYTASVQIEVGARAGQRRRAALAVRTADGVTAENWTETSTAANHVAADRKHGTRHQRVFTPFTVPENGGPVTLSLRTDAGKPRVRFAAVRVAAGPHRTPGPEDALVHEDFEHVPQGWGPFVKGDAGGVTDPRTHIAQRNAPYTQRGWQGKAIDDVVDGGQSLKSRGENTGLVHRTVPHTVRFRPGRRYRVTFRYENEKAGQYAWITAVDTPEARELSRTPLPAATEPTRHTYTFTAPADGETWVGLRKTGDDTKAEFVLDTFTVTELD